MNRLLPGILMSFVTFAQSPAFAAGTIRVGDASFTVYESLVTYSEGMNENGDVIRMNPEGVLISGESQKDSCFVIVPIAALKKITPDEVISKLNAGEEIVLTLQDPESGCGFDEPVLVTEIKFPKSNPDKNSRRGKTAFASVGEV